MKLPRLFEWLVIAVILLGVIYLLRPENLPVVLYKLSLVVVAGVVGYRLDRGLFPYGRPDRIARHPELSEFFGLAMVRRAIVVAACIIGVTMGL